MDSSTDEFRAEYAAESWISLEEVVSGCDQEEMSLPTLPPVFLSDSPLISLLLAALSHAFVL